MQSISKKTITISLMASLLIYSPATAAIKDDIASLGYSNATPSGKWTDPIKGTNYFYGGNIMFKFKNNNSYTPWIQVGPPKKKFGCNGVSIDAGFMSLIGLSDIEDQLKGAGSSFAWGIMLGLAVSVPVVKEVFSEIQRFSRMIQELLGNACSMGQKLAQTSEAGKGVRQLIDDSLIGETFQTFKKAQDGAAGQLKAVNDYIEDAFNSFGTNNDKKTNGLSSILIGKNTLISSGYSATSSIIGKYIYENLENSPYASKLNVFKLDNAYSSLNGSMWAVTSTVIDSVTPSDKSKSDAIALMILHAFYGDIGTPTESIKDLTNLFGMSSSFSIGAKEADKENVKSFFETALISGDTKNFGGGATIIKPVIEKDLAARAFIYGYKATSSNATDDNIKIPNRYIFAISFKTETPSKGTGTTPSEGTVGTGTTSTTSTASNRTIKSIWIVDKATDGETVSFKWEGAYAESVKAVRYLVKEKSGKTGTSHTADMEKATGDGLTNHTDTIEPTSVSFPLALPGIDKYINTIAKLENKANGITPYSEHLKQLLGRFNAYYVAESMGEMMISRISDAMSDPKVAINDEATRNMQNFMESVKMTHKDIMDEIRTARAKEISFKEINEIFENIDKEQRKESISGFNGKN